MTKEDYVSMLAEVQRCVSDTKTQVAFLESMVKFLPLGQQRGVRAYFADVHSHLRHALHGLEEQEEWLNMYCPPQSSDITTQLSLELPSFHSLAKGNE